MTVRTADISDLAAICALEEECFTDPWSEDSFRSAFADGHCVFLVAQEDGIVGYALFSVFMEDAELMSLAVAPGHRQRGVGRAIMAEALRIMRERGAARVFLEVRESNEAARALYASLGFGQIRVIRGYYRRPTEDAIAMCLPLERSPTE